MATNHKIYVFNNGGGPGWYTAQAIGDDGHALASHVCSHEVFMAHDMGITSDWKHENYNAHFGEGNWELEWVPDPNNHVGLDAAYILNQELSATTIGRIKVMTLQKYLQPPATGCDASCWAMPECTVCHRTKHPHGRDPGVVVANGYCTSDCAGYSKEPRAGHFWADEGPELSNDQRNVMLLRDILTTIGNSYPNDPGTSDLDDEQPVTVSMTLKEVRFAWRMLRLNGEDQ